MAGQLVGVAGQNFMPNRRQRSAGAFVQMALDVAQQDQARRPSSTVRAGGICKCNVEQSESRTNPW